jgi:hypothetical protein
MRESMMKEDHMLKRKDTLKWRKEMTEELLLKLMNPKQLPQSMATMEELLQLKEPTKLHREFHTVTLVKPLPTINQRLIQQDNPKINLLTTQLDREILPLLDITQLLNTQQVDQIKLELPIIKPELPDSIKTQELLLMEDKPEETLLSCTTRQE